MNAADLTVTASADSQLESAALTPELQHMQAVFREQKEAYTAAPFPPYAARKRTLDALEQVVRNNIEALQGAVSNDFGHRSHDETLLTEVMGILKGISYARKHLRRWMAPRKRPVDINFKPASAQIIPQPLGVVGIMSPWNFPFGLVFKPLVAALAAGNRAMIKPSELTPAVAALLAELLGDIFEQNQVCVIQGGVEVAAAFTHLPFDHLLFTGSTHNGKRIMAAAAEHLTPLTLELGGKSPVILDRSADMATAVKSIATGKLLNAGQTCTAPDYLLLPQELTAQFIEAFQQTVQRMYPQPLQNPDFTAVINHGHYDRLQTYLAEAAAAGAEVINLYPNAESCQQSRKLLPTLVVAPAVTTRIMNEEIFGPILILIPYQTLPEAVAFINRRPRPLALYLFGRDPQVEQYVTQNTIAGGVTLNDTLLHYAQESLPFGGVGSSGFGAYHGEFGFNTFSHLKPVFKQSRINGLDLLRAPYTKMSKWLLKNIIRMS